MELCCIGAVVFAVAANLKGTEILGKYILGIR